jgi:hypothetical protein
VTSMEALRDEFARLGVGESIHALLAVIVVSTVRDYPATEYSNGSEWDRSNCEDVLHDWIAERLWGRRDLETMLAAVETVGHLRAMLTTSLRQHLINKRRRSIALNLYKRADSILRTDAGFVVAADSPRSAEQRWTTRDNPSRDRSQASVRELYAIVSKISDEEFNVVRYGPFSQKLSPILRNPDLRRFLDLLLRNANGSLSLSTMVEVMRHRFSLPLDRETDLDDALLDDLQAAPSITLNRGVAESVIRRLEFEEAIALAAYFKHSGDFAIASASSNLSQTQVEQSVAKAFGMICELSETVEEARFLMGAVESLLSMEGKS